MILMQGLRNSVVGAVSLSTNRYITSFVVPAMSNQGALRTFDITPDGKAIVFDRSRQNSNIVLIDLPK